MTTPEFHIALAVIRHPDGRRILIALRKTEAHLGDLWEFPGGKCRNDETLAQCAIREAREETGIDVTVLEAWPAVRHRYPDRMVILHPFLCQSLASNAHPWESRAIAWVTPEELSQFAFPPANAPILARLLEGERP